MMNPITYGMIIGRRCSDVKDLLNPKFWILFILYCITIIVIFLSTGLLMLLIKEKIDTVAQKLFASFKQLWNPRHPLDSTSEERSQPHNKP